MSDLVYLKEKGKEFSVILVEDSMHIQKQMKNFLGKLFDKVFIANNGLEGLELFKKNLPDIVITDLTMPKMDGHEMVGKLLEISPKTQIIVISAHGYEENIVKFKKMGVCEFIQKPVDFNVLIMTLIKAIKNMETQHEVEDLIFEDELLKELFELKESSTNVELINHFKGLPLIHEAQIVDMTKDTISVKTEPIQTRVIRYEKKTFLQYKDLIVSARFDYYDPTNKLLVLKDIKREESSPKQREYVRVDPDSLFNASIFFHSERFNFEVMSVSSKAISFLAKKSDSEIKLGDEADIVLGFKTVYKASYQNEITHKERLTCKAKVIRYYVLSNEDVKIVFSLNLSLGNKKILEKYISQRQLETIKEFKSLKIDS